jgi:nitroimidazol reductase NimA-like FMN-containing flavoprotein (pyridoxamine 5'-phosphate oxidase superfamily)
MQRSDKEITDQKIIDDILSKSEICRIGISDIDTPYIVPLNYGYFDGVLYFHSASQGRKVEMLRKNSRVSFEIEYASAIIKGDQPCSWSTKYRSLMGTGTVEIVNDPEGIRKGLDVIMTHYGNRDNVYDEAYLERIVILKLHIDNISGKQSGEWGIS